MQKLHNSQPIKKYEHLKTEFKARQTYELRMSYVYHERQWKMREIYVVAV